MLCKLFCNFCKSYRVLCVRLFMEKFYDIQQLYLLDD